MLNYTKVHIPYFVSFLFRTPIFEWECNNERGELTSLSKVEEGAPTNTLSYCTYIWLLYVVGIKENAC
jgi:hypothetical protein